MNISSVIRPAQVVAPIEVNVSDIDGCTTDAIAAYALHHCNETNRAFDWSVIRFDLIDLAKVYIYRD